uniref:GTPase IMAP family member 8 n=1 Tax=Myripristis murdjan TaxID=586833 RepID=A0A667YNE3_9TELE
MLDRGKLRVLLLGWKGVGKSSVGNSILGRRDFEAGQETELCLRRQALVSGRRVTIVDTPGWDWFSVRRTPKRIRHESQRGAALLRPGPHTLLLVLPVVSSLTARKRRTLLAHIETLFGDNACLHTMVLFSCGDWLGRTPIEEHILRGGRELHRLLEYCGNYYHVLDSKTPGKDRSISDLLDKIEEMIRENGDEAFLPIQSEWCKSQLLFFKYHIGHFTKLKGTVHPKHKKAMSPLSPTAVCPSRQFLCDLARFPISCSNTMYLESKMHM